MIIRLVVLGVAWCLAGAVYGQRVINLKPAQADSLIRVHALNADLQVLDVRTPEEYSKSTIEKSVNIDFWNPDFSKQLFGLEKSRTYLVYCTTGYRSRRAGIKMYQSGLTKIYNLKGGILAWRRAGLPLIKPEK